MDEMNATNDQDGGKMLLTGTKTKFKGMEVTITSEPFSEYGREFVNVTTKYGQKLVIPSPAPQKFPPPWPHLSEDCDGGALCVCSCEKCRGGHDSFPDAPYPFCVDKAGCAGLSGCPKDHACND